MPEGAGQVVDRGRSPAALHVGELDGGELLQPAFTEDVELSTTLRLPARVSSVAVSAAF